MGVRNQPNIRILKRGATATGSIAVAPRLLTDREKVAKQASGIGELEFRIGSGQRPTRKSIESSIYGTLREKLYTKKDWDANQILITFPDGLKFKNNQIIGFPISLHLRGRKKDSMVGGDLSYNREWHTGQGWVMLAALRNMKTLAETPVELKTKKNAPDPWKVLSKADEDRFNDFVDSFRNPFSKPIIIVNAANQYNSGNVYWELQKYLQREIFRDRTASNHTTGRMVYAGVNGPQPTRPGEQIYQAEIYRKYQIGKTKVLYTLSVVTDPTTRLRDVEIINVERVLNKKKVKIP